MARSVVKFLIYLGLLPVLASCGTARPDIKVGDDYDLGRQNVVHVSERQKAALTSLFNSGVPIKSVRWPSNSVIHLFSNQDFFKGVQAPLPSDLARRYGKNEALKRSAWNVYQASVARGLDKPLIRQYFNSQMGKREIRGMVLLNRAYDCYGAFNEIPQNIKEDANSIFDTGRRVGFTCPKKKAKPKKSQT